MLDGSTLLRSHYSLPFSQRQAIRNIRTQQSRTFIFYSYPPGPVGKGGFGGRLGEPADERPGWRAYACGRVGRPVRESAGRSASRVIAF